MSDAARGSVEPSAEASKLIAWFGAASCEVGRSHAFTSPDYASTKAALEAYVARLESSSSPTPSPRADGVEPRAWEVVDKNGHRWALRETAEGAEDARQSYEDPKHGFQRDKFSPFRVVPLYAGAAPTVRGTMTNAEFLEMRNVEVPCEKCGGWGVRAYGSTATWHGGMGGQMITSDVCDRCWGSGDEKRRWPSHRLLRTGSAPPSGAGVSEEMRDAERYQWIRNNAQSGLTPSGFLWSFNIPVVGGASDWLGEGIDFAIKEGIPGWPLASEAKRAELRNEVRTGAAAPSETPEEKP